MTHTFVLETLFRNPADGGMWLWEWDGLEYNLVVYPAEEVRRWHDATYPIRLQYGDPRCFDGYVTLDMSHKL